MKLIEWVAAGAVAVGGAMFLVVLLALLGVESGPLRASVSAGYVLVVLVGITVADVAASRRRARGSA